MIQQFYSWLYAQERCVHMCIRRNQKNGHDSIICDNPKLQITQKSINRRMET